MEPQPAVVLEDVSFAYDGVPILTGVTLRIDEGDFASVIGPNGGGKTTLLKLILGLLRPQRGVIRVLDQTPLHARTKVGYVPQFFQFDTSFPVRVIDVVLMGRLHRIPLVGRYHEADREASLAALRAVDLDTVATHVFASLSGGQRQRVLIARALASEPRLLLLDEPTANVDPAVQDELMRLLDKLSRDLTIMMVTHDMGFVSATVRRVVCVNRTVAVHPTSALTGDTISELYHADVRMVRHDHRCAEQGHEVRHG